MPNSSSVSKTYSRPSRCAWRVSTLPRSGQALSTVSRPAPCGLLQTVRLDHTAAGDRCGNGFQRSVSVGREPPVPVTGPADADTGSVGQATPTRRASRLTTVGRRYGIVSDGRSRFHTRTVYFPGLRNAGFTCTAFYIPAPISGTTAGGSDRLPRPARRSHIDRADRGSLKYISHWWTDFKSETPTVERGFRGRLWCRRPCPITLPTDPVHRQLTHRSLVLAYHWLHPIATVLRK